MSSWLTVYVANLKAYKLTKMWKIYLSEIFYAFLNLSYINAFLIFNTFDYTAEVYSGPSRPSRMEHFTKIVNDWNSLTGLQIDFCKR